MTGDEPFRLSALHKAWRLFPPRQRRRLLTAATALLAPRIDRDLPVAAGGNPPPGVPGIALLAASVRYFGLPV